VTKHSDYIIWKDTSEHVAWHCEDTIKETRLNSCVQKHLFFEGPKNHQEPPEMLSSTRYHYHVFKISWQSPPKKLRRFLKPHFVWFEWFKLSNELIRGKVLRSCFLHWTTASWRSRIVRINLNQTPFEHSNAMSFAFLEIKGSRHDVAGSNKWTTHQEDFSLLSPLLLYISVTVPTVWTARPVII